MVRKIHICIYMILTILTIFTTTAVADTTPPESIANLHIASYGKDYIEWVWTDPTTPDFDRVDIYINGEFKTHIEKGVQYYKAIDLLPYTTYSIGTHTVDTSGNINQTWKNSSKRTAKDSVFPNTITGLHVDSYGPDYIKWAWTDPSDLDFSKTKIYINGIYKTSVSKGKGYYNVIGLSLDTDYTIGIQTTDTSGNINPEYVANVQRTSGGGSGGGRGGGRTRIIRFVTIGDPHLTTNTSADQYQRFTRAINYINGRSDIDFVVIMGDIVDTASISNFAVAKSALDRLNVPYYVVEGNHDVGTIPGKNFRTYIGPTEHIEHIRGYQLIFVGTGRYANGANYWVFDYSTADKGKPTLIFSHGPVQPKPGGTSCISDWGNYFGYACNMKSEVDSFTKLLGYYAGHVHKGTDQKIGGVLYVTSDNLGGNGPHSDYIGYNKVQNGVLSYSLVRY